jgi:outer membrane protein assembly factor BamB
MDGATGLVEWQTPDSFAYGINAGRLTSNLAMPAFVATDANLTRVFSGSPYALVNELPLRMILSQSAVLDFDGNGSDELYALVAGVGLGRFDPLSGQTNVFAPTRSGDRAPNVGRLSAGGTSLALVTAANDARGGFRVVDIGTGATVHDQTNERGPFTSAAYFDPDGSGTMRVALLSEVNRSALPQFALTVIDAETGQVVGRQLLPSVEGFINGPVRLSGGNFDGAPGDELAVTGVAGGTVVFHGATLGEFWRKDEPEFIEVSAAVAAPDLDGDGRAELIQVYEPLGSSRGIRALHGESGEILWDSGPASLALQEELRVGDYDGTVGLELLLTGPNVRAFDVATGAFKWELAPVGMPQPFYRYTAWGAGTPACRIGMLLGDYFAGSNRMQTFRCADLSPEAVHWIPEGTRSVAALDSDGVVWAISAAGTVWLGGPGLPSTPLSLPQEMTLVQARPGNAMRQGPGHIDLLLGSNLRLVTFRVAGDGLFANRFEAP